MTCLASSTIGTGVVAVFLLAIIPSAADAAKAFGKGYLSILITATNAHRAQNGRSRTVPQRISAQGYSFCFYAENVFSYWGTVPISASAVATKAVEWWKQSPGHNANMLNPMSKDIGVGMYSAYIGGQTVWKAVQVFAAPNGSC